MTTVSSTASRWAWAGLLALTLFGLVLRATGGAPLRIDRWWHDAISVRPGTVPGALADALAAIGGGFGAVACSAVAVALLLAARERRAAAAVATAMLLALAVSGMLDLLAGRDRPADRLYEPFGGSYPSGHTMGAAALAISLALLASHRAARGRTSWIWAAAAFWIALMAWSRTALHVHWLSDVIAGAVLGCCAAVLSCHWWAARDEPMTSRQKRGP